MLLAAKYVLKVSLPERIMLVWDVVRVGVAPIPWALGPRLLALAWPLTFSSLWDDRPALWTLSCQGNTSHLHDCQPGVAF